MHTKVNSVGDIGGNIGDELESIVGVSKNSQEMNIVQSWKKNSGFTSYTLQIYLIF